MFHRTMQSVVALVLFTFAGNTSAAFVSGVERFDGNTLDLTTWELMDLNEPPVQQISQTDSLVIDTRTPNNYIDYVTRSQTVAIGQRVRVDATLFNDDDTGGGQFFIYLTNNSSGSSKARTETDTQWVAIVHDLIDQSASVQIRDTPTDGTNFFWKNLDIVGDLRTYEIDRLSSTDTKFTAYDDEGNVISTKTMSAGPFTDPLFIALGTSRSQVLFDNVVVEAVPAEPIPLPPALIPAMLLQGLIVTGAIWKRTRKAKPE